jgi:hypothetical protein
VPSPSAAEADSVMSAGAVNGAPGAGAVRETVGGWLLSPVVTMSCGLFAAASLEFSV